MDFRILGQLEVAAGDGPLPLGGARQRALLALLLVHANEPVSADRLVGDLWGDDAPRTATNTVQVYVSRLRKLLGPRRLLSRPSGYCLQVAPEELDRARFEALVAEAQESGPEVARHRLGQALALWRGPALADVAYEEGLQAEIRRLEELRLAALEQRIEADLALDRLAALVPELERLVAEHPLRERFRAQLMLALYRSGRQAEALAQYRDARATLVEELGIEPGQALQDVHRAVLDQDPALAVEPHRRGQPAYAAAQEARKVVTCLLCDVSLSPALAAADDPEVLRAILGRYLESLGGTAERYRGVVATFVGDSALVVFGLRAVHEDDALRAVRAAQDIQAALPGLGLAGRIGIATGAVITGGEGWPATGEPVRAAAVLAAGGAPGDVLISAATMQLVREAVAVELGPPLLSPGRDAPLEAWRVLSIAPDVDFRRHDVPFVGREEELASLERELRRTVVDGTCRLCTVVGVPGVGKTRLARELAASVGDHVRVVEGRCLSYGEGITYRPLVEIVEQAVGVDAARGLDRILAAVPEGPLVARRIAGALGYADTAGTAEETFWAFRRLFETLAAESPLAVVVDDVHSAEATLLDLLEYVAGSSRGAPILLLCLARTDLFELRPSWGMPRPNATLVSLQPLSALETDRLVRGLADVYGLAEGEAPTIAAAAEGNPLFAEQLVAMRLEQGAAESDLAVPPTIQALLAERIDRLAPEERAVLERAAVAGTTFQRAAVAELLPTVLRETLATSLVSLLYKELIRPAGSARDGDDAYGFAHALIRDAAYEGIPKDVRAELHERFVEWLVAGAPDRAADDELLGHHLELAYRYRSELGRADDRAAAVASRAGSHLAAAGERAYTRDDMSTAARLLERALALPWGRERERLELGLRRASALLDSGRTTEAEKAADAAAAEAAEAGDRAGELRAALFHGQITIWTEPDFAALLELAEGALPVFEDAGDARGAMEAWRVFALAALDRERYDDAAGAFAVVLEHARRLDARVDEREVLGWMEYALAHGPVPVQEILRWADESSLPVEDLEPAVGTSRAVLLAMDGRPGEARALYARSEARLQELGMEIWLAAHSEFAWHLELLAGDYAAAEQQARRGCAVYEEMGSSTGLGLCAGMVAAALCAQERDDDALEWSAVAERNMPADGISVDSGGRRWRQVRARVLARRGEVGVALELAQSAVACAERTDSLRAQAEALLDLAEVLGRGGRSDEAAAASARAAQLAAQKGILAIAEVRAS